MKMAHAKLIHMENGGVALSLIFRCVYMPNMGGCECLQVGIVSTKFPARTCVRLCYRENRYFEKWTS